MALNGRSKQEVVSEFRCSAILDAGRSVFARRGYEAATVEEIAEAAGVAKGTVYLYFKSKREIYLAALRVDIAAIHAETRLAMEAEPTADRKLRAFIATRFRFCEVNRDFFKIYYSEFANIFTHPAQNSAMVGIYRQQVGLLKELLEELQSSGEIRPLPAGTLAHAVYDTTRCMIANRVMGWLAGDVERDIDVTFELLWNGMAVKR